MRLPFDLLERVGHYRELARGPRDREADQMRERDLLAGLGELRVELTAPGIEHVHSDFAERSGSGDRQAVGHVLRETGRGAGDRGQMLGRGGGNARRGPGAFSGGDRPVPRSPSLVPQDFGAVRRNHRQLGKLPVVKQLPPLLADRGRIPQVLLVHHLHERGVVRAEHELAHGSNLIK